MVNFRDGPIWVIGLAASGNLSGNYKLAIRNVISRSASCW